MSRHVKVCERLVLSPTTTDLSWLVDAALLGASERQLLRGTHHHLAAGQVGIRGSIQVCATPCM